MVGGANIQSGWLREGLIRGNMLSKSIVPTDEELGKKDDDHKPGAHGNIPSWFLGRSIVPFRWRRRRILLAAMCLFLIFLLLRVTPYPSALLTTSTQWNGDTTVPTDDYDVEPTGPPPGSKKRHSGSAPAHDYDGQIKFYRLAASLHAAAHTNGYRQINRNVLFAMSNLRSASILLPMVCEMAKWNRNYVHAAFMGREDIPLAVLLDINGVDKESCPAMWHDARPDYTEYSSEARAESSVSSALVHIHSFLHPQAIIMDDSLSEDAFFVKGIRSKAKFHSIPIIEIPKDQWESFLWITRLDAGSLRSWHKPLVDILLQVPPGSSGGVIKLLKSLRNADYTGLAPPRLTIELAANADSSLNDYLRDFSWPPHRDANSPAPNQVTIRRRVVDTPPTQEDSAIRLLELFYPTSPSNSHVLILGPDAEVSPLYYHYIKYTLLEYRYSSYGEDDSANLMGISLERPSTLLDGASKLDAPRLADMHSTSVRYTDLFPSEDSIPFLWQAPSCRAALYFGDKWVELHSFITNRIAKHHQSPVAARPKIVSESLPAWAEYVLELMRARGYSFLYPDTKGSRSLVTLHKELYQLPGEFSQDTKANDADPFSRSDNAPRPSKGTENALIPGSWPLHLTLPFDGLLPEVPDLAYLGSDGAKLGRENVSSAATSYADTFRESVGGCQKLEGKHRKITQWSAEDLFCFGDEDEEQWEEDHVGAMEEVEPTTRADPDLASSEDAVASTFVEPTSTSVDTIASAEAINI